MEIAAAEAASTNSRAGFAQVKKFTDNYCSGAKPSDDAFNNFDCAAAIENQVEQAGANVTKGFVGLADGDDAASPRPTASAKVTSAAGTTRPTRSSPRRTTGSTASTWWSARRTRSTGRTRSSARA